MNLSPHFTLEEMSQSQTAARLGIDNTPPPSVIDSLTLSCQNMELIRGSLKLQVPTSLILVSSGYRCPALNTAIHGSSSSQHMFGEAIDFTVKGWELFDAWKYIVEGPNWYDQIIYEQTWIHVSYTIKRSNRKQIMVATFINKVPKYATYTLNQVKGFTSVDDL